MIPAGHPTMSGDQGPYVRNQQLRGGGEMDEYYEYRRTARRPNNAFVRAMLALHSTPLALARDVGVSAHGCGGWIFVDGAAADCAGVDQEYCVGVHDVLRRPLH